MKKANELLAIVKETERKEEKARLAKIEKYVNNLLIQAEERAKQGYYYIFDNLICENSKNCKDVIATLQALGYEVETTRVSGYKISWYE